MIARRIWLVSKGLIIGSLLGLAGMTLVQAQQLTSAEVNKLEGNAVWLRVRGQPERQAKLKDRLVFNDLLRTVNARARLLFNEKSLLFISDNSCFRFRQGMRRQNLDSSVVFCSNLKQHLKDKGDKENLQENIDPSFSSPVTSTNLSQSPDASKTSAESGTILEILKGVALVVVPPGGKMTTIETPKSQVEIEVAAAAIPSSPDSSPKESPLPPEKSGNAALIVHQNGMTKVFALTDGLTISDPSGKEAVSPLGGQAVEATSAGVGKPFEFDLKEFYQTYTLATGLGPGQESAVAQESDAAVQQTLNTVRVATLAAVSNQERRKRGFTTFLRDALTGTESDLYRGQPVNTQVITSVDGIFTRTGDNSGTFTPTSGPTAGIAIPITLDFDNGTITIGGITGTASSFGLSGNNASGTVVLRNGQILRVEAFGVNGQEPNIDPQPGSSFPGRLTTEIAPDR